MLRSFFLIYPFELLGFYRFFPSMLVLFYRRNVTALMKNLFSSTLFHHLAQIIENKGSDEEGKEGPVVREKLPTKKTVQYYRVPKYSYSPFWQKYGPNTDPISIKIQTFYRPASLKIQTFQTVYFTDWTKMF